MNRLILWLRTIFDPVQTNLKDGALEDILIALDSPTIRKRWINNLIDEIWEINITVDRLMEAEDDTQWKRLSQRRNAIIFVLNEILNAKDELASEIEEQERQNRILESYQGTAAQLPRS